MRLLDSRHFKSIMLVLLTLLSAFAVGYGISFVANTNSKLPNDVLEQVGQMTQPARRTAVLGVSDSAPDDDTATAIADVAVVPATENVATTAVAEAPTMATPPAVADGSIGSADTSSAPATSMPALLPTASPTITSTIAANVRIVADTFDDPAGGWISDTDTTSSAGYVGGSYRLAINGQQSLGVSQALPNVESYRVTANVTIRSGNAGLVFLSAKPATFYRFLISADGRFGVHVVQQDPNAGVLIVPWTASSAIQRGFGLTNRLVFDRRGTNVRIYANDEPLMDLTIPPGNFTSQYGFALMSDDGVAEALFDNLVVERLPPQP